MQFEKPLQRWAFSHREKRFFMYGTGVGEVAHCANTGSMKGLLEHASHMWVRDYGTETTRKLRYGAELLELPNGTLAPVFACINTAHANTLAGEALAAGLVPNFPIILGLQKEVKFSAETRFDWAFATPKYPRVWCEVKNVTMAEGGVGLFPDAVTVRGTKHLNTLAEIVKAGGKALQVYVVARNDCTSFAPAKLLDPAYTQALKNALAAGVQVVALACEITPQGINVCQTLPVVV